MGPGGAWGGGSRRTGAGRGAGVSSPASWRFAGRRLRIEQSLELRGPGLSWHLTAEEYQQENHVHTCSAIIVTRLITEVEVIIRTEAGVRCELTPGNASDARCQWHQPWLARPRPLAASHNAPLHLALCVTPVTVHHDTRGQRDNCDIIHHVASENQFVWYRPNSIF